MSFARHYWNDGVNDCQCFVLQSHVFMIPSTDVDPRKVLMVIGHHSFVAVAFAHSVFCYRWVAWRFLLMLSKGLLFALLIVPLFFCFFVLDPKTRLAGSLFSLLLICITLWKEWLWMQRCHPVLLETKCWQFHQVGLLKLFKGVEEHIINSTLPQDKGRFNIFITSRDKEKPESPVGF